MTPDLSKHAILCGLCALIPLPWVDEWAERKARRQLYRDLAAARGVVLPDTEIEVLVEDRSSLVLGCLFMALVWPVKKLFRTVFYFLTLKDVVDGVALAGHRAAMLDAALRRGVLPGKAEEVRAEMDAVLGRYRWSPISRLVLGGEKPEAPWPGPELPVQGATEAVTLLFRYGGGGHLLADFLVRLEKIA